MFKTKFFLALFLALAIGFLAQSSAQAFWFKKKIEKSQTPVFAPVNDIDGNKIWIGTFQLVWNDLINDIVKAPVQFKGGNSELADLLNKQGFDVSMLNKESYYKAHGIMTPKFKKEIEKDIWHQFGEKSDILNGMNWNSKGYLIYAMLIKNFEYLTEFEVLGDSMFGDKKVLFFGINENSDKVLFKNVEVLFYNSKDDYAVKLLTKDNEEVILYRTDDTLSLEEYFSNVTKNEKSFKGEKKFKQGDSLKVPYIKFNKMFSYDELVGKRIKGSNFIIDGAIQTAKFSLDNKGGKLKSEAAIMMKMSLAPMQDGREFNFDKPFVLFLKEQDKSTPYFIMDVKNGELLEEVY